MNFTIFESNTGRIIQSGTCAEHQLSIQSVPNGCELLPIFSDVIDQYIENGIAKTIPQKPDQFSVFDYKTKTWIDTRSDEEKNIEKCTEVKKARELLLSKSDWTQIPNNPLTPAKQEEWAVYRQQLRDITNQPGYPFNVVWPVKPE